MYDTFSVDYDRFVNWENRLAYEIPFIKSLLQKLETSGNRPLQLLDAGCGTGMHAIALAQAGYQTAGADLSSGMIAKARENAWQAGVEVRFEVSGFGGLAPTFLDGNTPPFDALLCLGNSLPHLLTREELTAAVADFAACLRPGGLILIQNRNFDSVTAHKDRWMEPQAYQEGGREWLFVRFYDFISAERINFNILTLRKLGEAQWQQEVISTPLRPLTKDELIPVLELSGFEEITAFGDLGGSAFDPETSSNLVLSGFKRSS